MSSLPKPGLVSSQTPKTIDKTQVQKLEDPFHIRAFPFKTEEEVKAIIQELYKHLEKAQTAVQYIEFRNVPPQIFKSLSGEDSEIRGLCTLKFDSHSKTLIVKVMAGYDHELAMGFFLRTVDDQLRQMNVEKELWCLYTAKMIQRQWHKQADIAWCLVPANFVDTKPQPTLVVEIGVSESLERLRGDAEGWLKNGSAETQIVLIASVNQVCGPPKVIIEKYEFDKQDESKRKASKSFSVSISKTDSVELTRLNDTTQIVHTNHITAVQTNSVSAIQIHLPFQKLLNRAPNPTKRETDLIITGTQMQTAFEDVWRMQKLF
jgi:hypothetical protein